MFRLHFLTLLSAVIAVLPFAIASPKLFTAPSGKQISFGEIEKHLRTIPEDIWTHHVVEITSTHELITSTYRKSLAEAPLKDRIHSSDLIDVTVNGVKTTLPPFRYKTRTAHSYTASFHPDGTPFALSQNGYNLQPLNLDSNPGIFVRVPPPTLEGDVIIPPPHGRPPPAESPPKAACIGNTDVRRTEIAVAFDNTFCMIYRNDVKMALAVIVDAFDLAEEPFRRDTCIRLKVTSIESHCLDSADPYAAIVATKDNSIILAGFRNFWNVERTTVSRDLGYLVTGDRTNGPIGTAYLGVSCGLTTSYGWVETVASILIAHELGHNYDAPHTTTDGLYDIMDPTLYHTVPHRFSPSTISTISNFVDSTSITCMQPAKYNYFALVADPMQTCMSGYTRINVADCTEFEELGTFTKTLDGVNVKATVKVAQQDGGFNVTIVTKKGKIRKYGRLVSFNDASKSDLGLIIKPKKRTKEITSIMSSSVVGRPSGMSTCCGETLKVHVWVRLCNNKTPRTCGAKFQTYDYTVKCVDVCSGSNAPGFHYGWRYFCPFCSFNGPIFT